MSNCDLTRCRVCSCKWGGASEKACTRSDCPAQRPMTTPGATEAVTPEQRLAAAMRELLPYHGVTNSWGKQEALLSSCAFIESALGRARCDAEASADCVRCNAVFLARTVKTVIESIRSLLPKEEGK